MTEKPAYRILAVDDEGSILKALERLMRRAGYQVETAESGAAGLALLEAADAAFDLIISDQRMPEMQGAEFLEKSKVLAPDAGRILLTGYSDFDALVDAVNKGEIHRYMSKPWNDEELLLTVNQTIEQVILKREHREMTALIQRQNEELQQLNKNLEHKVVERSRQLVRQKEDFEDTFMEAFRLLSALVEMLSPPLGEYLLHVGRLSRRVAQHLGLEREACDLIEIAGLFHDVGLVGMPESLLYQEHDEMGETVFNIFSHHPVIAAVSFESVPTYAGVSDIIINHHEYLDGSGYPNQRKGEEIPLGSRIVAAVSDYHRILDLWPDEAEEIRTLAAKILPEEVIARLPAAEGEILRQAVAKAHLVDGAGTRYDPRVVEALEKVLSEADAAVAFEKWVGVEELEEGMTLRRAIYLESGQPLMSKGLRLNAKLIESLRKIHRHGKIPGRIYVATDHRREA
ncbi:MAG: response regulator [Desulfosarcinaceae bacterium]|jgi:response regulator RpfG family c-di-GMP phosphodiesterase